MFELINILFIFTIFLLLTCVPFGIFNFRGRDHPQPNFFKIKSLNLIINLNTLLLISLLPLTISEVKNYILITYLIIFISIYWKKIPSFFSKNYILNIIFFFIIFFILTFNILYNLELEWHAQIYDYLKYLVFFQDGVYSELNSYDWKKIGSSHFHPHFGQYLWAFFAKVSLISSETYGRLFHLFLYCFSLICLINQFITLKNTLKFISFILLIFLTYDYDFFSGTQEILIFSFLVLLSINIFNIYNKKEYTIDFYAYLLTSNLLIWIKAEGFVYALILLLCIYFSPLLKKYKLIALFSYVIFNLFKYIVFELNEFSSIPRPGLYTMDYILNLDLNLIILRIKLIITWLIYYISVNEIWIICLICMSLLILKIKDSNINYKFLYLFFMLDILFIFLSYIFHSIDTMGYIRATLSPEIFSTSGFFVITIMIYVEQILNIKTK